MKRFIKALARNFDIVKKLFCKNLKKVIDKTGKVWYLIIRKRQGEAVSAEAKGTEGPGASPKKISKKIKNLLTNRKKRAIL